MTTQPLASQVIAKVADDYRRCGYDVEIAPSGPGLPEFLGGFQPDLIARNPDESVVVEVKVGTRTSVAERLRDVAERVSRQPGWRFALVFVSPDQPDQVWDAPPAPLLRLQERARNAESLLQAGQSEAAFLLLWSALEGILRLLGHRAQLPLETLPPSTLIRELYSAGEISMKQFESLMRLLPVRNRLVHGFGGGQDDVDVEQLRQIVRELLAEANAA
jgi:REase_AHJR-like